MVLWGSITGFPVRSLKVTMGFYNRVPFRGSSRGTALKALWVSRFLISKSTWLPMHHPYSFRNGALGGPKP